MAHIYSKRYNLSSLKDIKKLSNELAESTVKCKCSHSVVMPNADRIICSWCGRWIYRTPQIKFKYELMKKIKERK